jgi:hypothetical protein
MNGERLFAATDFLFLTNLRLFQLNMFSKIKSEIQLEYIERFSTSRKKLAQAGPLIVHTNDGQEHRLGILLDSEWQRFNETFELLKSNDNDFPNNTIFVDDNSNTSLRELGYTSSRTEDLGLSILDLPFGSYSVEIFKNGFVRVYSAYGFKKTRIEKLIDIDCESQLTKKTGLGRALGASVTLGMNMAAPGQRGNLILTITTDADIHVLTHNVPFDHDIENMHKIVSTGKAIIKSRDVQSSGLLHSNTKINGDLVEKIKELVILRETGAISDDEFTLMKQKLIAEY